MAAGAHAGRPSALAKFIAASAFPRMERSTYVLKMYVCRVISAQEFLEANKFAANFVLDP